MAAHHLDDERTLVALRSGHHRVGGLDNALQRRVRADGHVGAAEVVVDGAHQAGNLN